MSNEIVRFTPKQRLEHVAIMTSFTLLCLTGFPQKFHESGWAHLLVSAFGGVGGLRLVHRVTGIVFTVLVIVHLYNALRFVLQRQATFFTIVPTRQDFRDAMLTLRYYLGLTQEKAQFDRYDYRQKFEYWGMVMGGLVMVVTGFVLLYPITAARLFPAEIIPASKVAHGSEGLMAMLVVIVWHIYNAHLSPDVFPFDKSIFTGKISRERMLHEHPLELARIEGTLPVHPSPPEGGVSVQRPAETAPVHPESGGGA